SGKQMARNLVVIDAISSKTMHLHYTEHRFTVDCISVERSDFLGDDGGLLVRLTAHKRGYSCGIGTAFIAVVRKSTRHQHGAKIGVPKTERTEVVAVFFNLLG